MNIIIVGAGRIGTNLSKSLALENNEVYLIERNEEKGRKIAEKVDAKLIIGNGADPETLLKAQVGKADLVLAVTTSDETNLVVCSLAHSFGAKRKIARVRNTSLSDTLANFGYTHFKIDNIINPELVAAQEIVKTVQTPGASEVADFADGKILLRGFDIPENSPLCGAKVSDFKDEDFPWPFLIVSIIRKDEVIIPQGETELCSKDHIYVLLPVQSLAEFLTYVNPSIKMPKKVVIYGATRTGRHVAEKLSEKIKDIMLIEEDETAAQNVAGELKGTRIINGSASEQDILSECGIEAADAFIATSNNDHSNLISSVLAKKMGAKITLIMTQQPDYLSIVDQLGIDAIINPHYLAVKQILHLVRGKGISSVTKLLESDMEVLEFIPEAGASITKAPLKKLKFPKDSIIGAVHNGENVELANGDTHIQEGQKVIVFCHSSAVKKFQELVTH
ncbi:MAG: Trk system potassium transporter TrkA [Candidatus Omnitrophica bacterium]|nr:Trk system potassium transporter TrkA [Candidatus Omnitrophota bacterium]MCB9747110.1 Trk system potassium transporter TrkA [Candidatus Omnitrophota bacterium]